jgi:hypothetical protein
MKPMPAKLRISIARVEGSGTPGLDLRRGLGGTFSSGAIGENGNNPAVIAAVQE